MKAALLPQSCCQTCPMFRRQQLTLFSSYSFYMQRQQGQRKSPVCPTSSAWGLFALYSHHQFFLTGIYFAALAVLISSRCRKAIRAGHPVPSSAPGSLWVTFRMVWEKPDLSGSAGAAFALPPCLSLSHSCQLPSVFLKTA